MKRELYNRMHEQLREKKEKDEVREAMKSKESVKRYLQGGKTYKNAPKIIKVEIAKKMK